jgi:type 1 glutamine amidotransferase
MRARTLVGAVACAALVASVTTATAASTRRVPHVLVYDQTLGFHHISIAQAEKSLRTIAKYDGPFTVQISQDPKVLSKATLARTDVVLWLSNTAATGRVSPFTDAQEKAYEQWMLCGGGHVGIHAAVDSYDDKAFPAYVKANGAIFTGHPITLTSALDDQDKDNEGWGEPTHTLGVVDQRSPITDPWHGRKTFQVHDELYQLDRDPKSVVTDFHLLIDHLSVDDPQGMVITQVYPGAYEAHAPMAWTGSYKHKNRTFYTNLGHSVLDWKNADYLRHVTNGVTWVAGHHVDRGCLSRTGFPG